jgi:hypothetical protein
VSLREHPLYTVWHSMKQRCQSVGHPNYPSYGRRGITVVPEWQSFERFLADMGPRPTNTTLERKDNNAGYSKANCEWATWKAQAQNRRPKSPAGRIGVLGVHWNKGYYQVTRKQGDRKWNLYHGQDFFEACCAAKSFEAGMKSRGGVLA